MIDSDHKDIATALVAIDASQEKTLGGTVHPYRRRDDTPRFSHNTVAILTAFATATLALHRAIEEAIESNETNGYWDNSAYQNTRFAVRCARMLVVREDLW